MDRFLWTCRAGFEGHLFEELAWARADPRMVGPGLVEARPRKDLLPAFGRAGFRVLWSGAEPVPEVLAGLLRTANPNRVICIQGWAVDESESLPRSSELEALATAVSEALPEEVHASTPELARDKGGVLGQVIGSGRELVIAGAVLAHEAVSLAPGGRQRMRRSGDAPSRASMKLEEALTELGLEPGPGEVCADLGAAPGGWTQRLVERGAKVWAIDPANLRPELTRNPKVRHVKESAFSFEPDEPFDWLFCDMAWRPLEVAQLLAKWARRRWATHLVANIKLPMNDKNPILWRVRKTLEDAGWRHLRVRQLYHDRDEVTVTARRAG